MKSKTFVPVLLLLVGFAALAPFVSAPIPSSAYFKDDFTNPSIADFHLRWTNSTPSPFHVSVNTPIPSVLNFTNGMVMSQLYAFQGVLQMRVNASVDQNMWGFSNINFQSHGGVIVFNSGGSGLQIAIADHAWHNYTLIWLYNDTNKSGIQYVQPCIDNVCLTFWRAYSNVVSIPNNAMSIVFGSFDPSLPIRVDWVAYDPVQAQVSTVTSFTTSIVSSITTTISTSISSTVTSITSTYTYPTWTILTTTTSTTTLSSSTTSTSTISSSTTTTETSTVPTTTVTSGTSTIASTTITGTSTATPTATTTSTSTTTSYASVSGGIDALTWVIFIVAVLAVGIVAGLVGYLFRPTRPRAISSPYPPPMVPPR